jgi:hypothetical protein
MSTVDELQMINAVKILNGLFGENTWRYQTIGHLRGLSSYPSVVSKKPQQIYPIFDKLRHLGVREEIAGAIHKAQKSLSRTINVPSGKRMASYTVINDPLIIELLANLWSKIVPV